MLHHEKRAFLKFFVIYFLSVATLILAVGFFYFQQMKEHFLKAEEFSMIEYARHIKMQESLESFGTDYSYHFSDEKQRHIDIRNFRIDEDIFIKLIPMENDENYLKLSKLKQSYNIKLSSLKTKIIAIQLFLLLLFGYISYLLAKSALKPLQESIITLDKFAKDLIHDLNTPVTSIKLNMKILEREEHLKDNSAMLRMKKSVQTISELHENLTILLQEETFQMQNINICDVVEDVVQMHRQIYPDIRFEIEHSNLKLKLNPKATKQILQNVISNYIEDSGKGIKEPDKIFDRLYSAEQSSGMGLDIVKRLENAMDIEIEVKSDDNGTVFILRK